MSSEPFTPAKREPAQVLVFDAGRPCRSGRNFTTFSQTPRWFPQTGGDKRLRTPYKSGDTKRTERRGCSASHTTQSLRQDARPFREIDAVGSVALRIGDAS